MRKELKVFVALLLFSFVGFLLEYLTLATNYTRKELVNGYRCFLFCMILRTASILDLICGLS